MSIKRIDTYLNAEELDPDCVSDKVQDQENAIEVQDGTFSWDEDSKPVLEK